MLRSFEPPGAEIRGRDLTALLTPAYLRLAGQEELTGEGQEIAGGDEDATAARGADRATAGEAEQLTAREAE